MRRAPNSLTLIVPNIARALEDAIKDGLSRWPCLACLAARGTLRGVAIEGRHAVPQLDLWERSVLEVLDLEDYASEYPSAAVSRTGATKALSPSCWAHLQWVHFAAGMSDMTAGTLQGDSALSNADEHELLQAVNEHVSHDGYEVLPGEGGMNLLRCPHGIEVDTIAPWFAFRGPLQSALPSGPSAAQLRRLMTELQMLLHVHPVNARRERRGLPAANAVWIWGTGMIEPERIKRAQALPAAFGTRPYLTGVYLLNDAVVTEQSFDVEGLIGVEVRGARLAVIEAHDLDELESRWLPVCARALREGSIEILSLHLDRWRIQVTRKDLLRFWRRPLAPMHWNA